MATAAAAPKQPNIFAAFGAKVPAKKSKEIELREKKDTAALLSPGVRLYSASLPASSKKRKHELGINDVAVNTDVSDRQKRLDHEAVRGFVFEQSKGAGRLQGDGRCFCFFMHKCASALGPGGRAS